MQIMRRIVRLNSVKISLTYLFLLVSFILSSFSLSAQRMVANDYGNILGRGMAMSIHRDDFYPKTLQLFKGSGFQHIRLRCQVPDNFNDNYTDNKRGFDNIVFAATKIIDAGLIPVVAWSNPATQETATNAQIDDFVNWWGEIANRMKNIPGNDKISFNLVVELAGSAKMGYDLTIYNNAIQRAVTKIRSIDSTRIIILPSPDHKGTGLIDIEPAIYTGDKYMMGEFHFFAAGPLSDGGKRNWTTGDARDQQNVIDQFLDADEWRTNTGIPIFFAAWMPMGNKDSNHGVGDNEAQGFARFFLETAENYKVPWTINAIQHFYEEKGYNRGSWVATKQFPDEPGGNWLDMPKLFNIVTTHGNFIWGNTSSVEVTNSDIGFGLNKHNDITIYPNQTSGNINININNNEFTNAMAKVVNTYGVTLETKTITNQENQVNLHSYNSGLYFIIVSYNNTTIIKSVVKN